MRNILSVCVVAVPHLTARVNVGRHALVGHSINEETCMLLSTLCVRMVVFMSQRLGESGSPKISAIICVCPNDNLISESAIVMDATDTHGSYRDALML